jgi:hypothetical protein
MSTIYSIITNAGQTALSNAAASGNDVVLTNFKVGSGNSKPLPTWTDIENPQYTGTFMGGMIQPIDSYLSAIKCVVPGSSGGYNITQVGLYYTKIINRTPTLVLFAITTYPSVYKELNSNYVIDLVIETSANSVNDVSLTVPNNQFATIQYVDIGKLATNSDIVNPLINNSVYITPYWLQLYLNQYGLVTQATATSTTFVADLTNAIEGALIRVSDNSTQLINGMSYNLVDGDLIYKALDPSTSLPSYTLLQQSNTQYVATSTNPYNVPLGMCANGVLSVIENLSSLRIVATLSSPLAFSNGRQSIEIGGNSILTFTRANNTDTVAIINSTPSPFSGMQLVDPVVAQYDILQTDAAGQAIDTGLVVDTDITLSSPTNLQIPTSLAVKTYVDNHISSSGWSLAPINTKVANYTIQSTDLTLIADANNITFTLPSVSSLQAGTPFVIKVNNFNNISLQPFGSDLIDGLNGLILNEYSTITVVANLTYWFIYNLYMPTPVGAIISYYVTTGQGYPANGLLIVPYGSISGDIALLLGDNGKSYIVDIIAISGSQISPVYLHVPSAQGIYPASGMLILKSGAVSGNACYLLGDNGQVYNLVYDGTSFSTIGTSVSIVSASSTYPVAGTLLTKLGATSGNSGLLFGSNNQIYYIVLP